MTAGNDYCSLANVNVCVQAGIEPLLTLKTREHRDPLFSRLALGVPTPKPQDIDTNAFSRMAHRLTSLQKITQRSCLS